MAWNGAVENQSKKVLNYPLHGFSILWRDAKQNAEGLVLPLVPNEAATQFLPLAERMVRYMANPDVPIAAKSAKLNKVRLETLFHGYHTFLKVQRYIQHLFFPYKCFMTSYLRTSLRNKGNTGIKFYLK